MLGSGERQVAPDISGIRRDHRARYEWARDLLLERRPRGKIVDVACGIGYGAHLLAQAGFNVLAIDRDAEAIAYGREHYAHPNLTFRVDDANALTNLQNCDVVTCFETIEHLAHPLLLLKELRAAPLLLASVPNEDHFPHNGGIKFHHRHYTRAQFVDLLGAAGFEAKTILGQIGPHSKVGKRAGRTIVAVAERRSGRVVVKSDVVAKTKKPKVPESVAILGLGLSLQTFVNIAKGMGGTHKVADEIWGINALGDLFQCDRVFHMDDVRVQEIRAQADPTSNIAAMLEWLKKHPGPVYTSQKHPDYPGLVEYPLAAVLNTCDGQQYMNSTAAHAIAFAIHLGVKKIMCFGMDFTLPNSYHAEQGRACVEFWLGFARARGIEIRVPKESSLLDACEPWERRIYGYDAVHLKLSGAPGAYRVRMKPRKELPTAADIEHRYDHSRHPNPLMRGDDTPSK